MQEACAPTLAYLLWIEQTGQTTELQNCTEFEEYLWIWHKRICECILIKAVQYRSFEIWGFFVRGQYKQILEVCITGINECWSIFESRGSPKTYVGHALIHQWRVCSWLHREPQLQLQSRFQIQIQIQIQIIDFIIIIIDFEIHKRGSYSRFYIQDIYRSDSSDMAAWWCRPGTEGRDSCPFILAPKSSSSFSN